MKTRHLEAEYASAVQQVRQPHLDRLRELGVQPGTVARINLAYPSFGVMAGEIEAGGVFVPGGGAMHIVQPVVEHEQLIDLVAWRSNNPQRWGLRAGVGWLLNADTALASRWDGELLQLHASPLSWLQANATGAVILDWDAREVTGLRSFERVCCANPVLGATLRRALCKPHRLPIIETMETRHAA